MGMMYCRGCGKEILESAPTCPQCGAPRGAVKNSDADFPPGVKGVNFFDSAELGSCKRS